MRTLKLTRYSEENVSIADMGKQIAALGKVLEEPVYGNETAWQLYVREMISFQMEEGGFPLVDTYRIEADCRVEFCHKPTYLCTAILMKALVECPDLLTGKEDIILPRALKMCCARGLQGHGYDGLKGQFEAMEIFIRGHVREFLERYAGLSPEFAEMIPGIIDEYKEFISRKQFVFGFGDNYERELRETVNRYEKDYVFVYGTLMEGQANYRRYLYPDKPAAKGIIRGFTMYDLGAFPGIVKGGTDVKGELFEISGNKLKELDWLEDNGGLYTRIWTEVETDEKKSFPAYVYIYNGSVEGMKVIPFTRQPYARLK